MLLHNNGEHTWERMILGILRRATLDYTVATAALPINGWKISATDGMSDHRLIEFTVPYGKLRCERTTCKVDQALLEDLMLELNLPLSPDLSTPAAIDAHVEELILRVRQAFDASTTEQPLPSPLTWWTEELDAIRAALSKTTRKLHRARDPTRILILMG